MDPAGAGPAAHRLRILVVTEAFPNPSETFIVHQVNGLIARGHDVTILATPGLEGVPVHAAVLRHRLAERVVVRPTPKGVQRLGVFRDAVRRIGWRRALRSISPWYGLAARNGRLTAAASVLGDAPVYDAILGHFGPNGELAAQVRAAGLLDGALLAFFHGVDVGTRSPAALRRRYPRLFRSGEFLLAASEHFRVRLEQAGVPRERLAVHRMGIEIGETQSYRPDAPLAFLTVGRLVAKKGIDTALRALAQAKLGDRDWRYHIVGDGVERTALTALATELGIAGRVEFHGWRDQAYIAALMARSTVMLAPSRTPPSGDTEACPLSISEGLIAGLVVCATRHGGIPEMIHDGETGLLCAESDHRALAGNIERVVADAPLASRLVAAGQAHIREQWDIERLNDLLVERIRTAIARRA
jgi:colanic acid/amylovoran biosynthesis glycosyltransferase